MTCNILFVLSAIANVLFVILLIRAEVLLGKKKAALRRANEYVLRYEHLMSELRVISDDESSYKIGED